MAGTPHPELRPVLDAIVAQSRFLHERIERASHRRGREECVPSREAGPLEATWRDALGGEPNCLELRLVAVGLDEGAVANILDSTPEPGASAHVGWTAVLEQALSNCNTVHEAARHGELASRYPFLDARQPFSIEAAYVPFVLAGRERLARTAATTLDMFSSAARTTLERELLRTLSQLGERVLEQELALLAGLAGAFPWSHAAVEVEDTHADRLIASLLGEGRWWELFAEYPVLARLLASQVEQWVLVQAELIERIGRCQALAPRQGTRRVVTAVTLPYSDPHSGGRTVLFVRDTHGRSIVYKPRSLTLERTFQELLACVNRCGYSHPFHTLAVEDAGDHGWMEVVEPVPCRDDAEANSLQYRIGGLLYLLSLLQSLDIHRENVIAAGAQPVIVDLETVVHPRFAPEIVAALGPGAARVDGLTADDRALLETGILPVPAPPGVEGFLDFSVLGAMPAPVKDAAAWLQRRDENVVAGYSEMFRLVCDQRATIRDCLDAFAGASGRVVFRSTYAYGLLLGQSLHPDLLRDGAARGIRFEVLRRHTLGQVGISGVLAVVSEELHALEHLDVPRFTAPIDCPGSPQASMWTRVPLDEVKSRLERATTDALPVMLTTLRDALRRCPAAEPAPLRAADGSDSERL